jgi:hypothetical protein
MQHASDDNASSSASENCDADSDEKNEHSDDDGSQQPSPSLFRQEQAHENADPSEDDDSEDNQSDDGSIPELCESEDEDEDKDDYQPSESTPAASSAAAVSQESLLEKFSELTRQFATLVEQNRKLDLMSDNMSRKSASKSLNFDSPKRRRAAPYTPRQRAPEIIAATQEEDDYEFERDSVRSSSSRSTRIRLQDKYSVIDEKPADFFTPTSHKDWIKKRRK